MHGTARKIVTIPGRSARAGLPKCFDTVTVSSRPAPVICCCGYWEREAGVTGKRGVVESGRAGPFTSRRCRFVPLSDYVIP